jgi:hypothetical protein
VLEDKTLLIPDRLGNNRADTIGNLLARPGIGLIFFVPGIDETLCVNGRARVTTEATLLEPLTVNGKKPRSGILVTAEEIYFHCGKALMRSDLSNSDKHLRRSEFLSLGAHSRRPDRRHFRRAVGTADGRELQNPALLAEAPARHAEISLACCGRSLA